MRGRLLSLLAKSEDAAIAPTVAIALFGLIAVGGLAFDYARMATLDTELQTAADQAALSAATQLDGLNNARSRADSAARSLISNPTFFANDNVGTSVAINTVTFYVDQAKTTLATGDSDAAFVEVAVASRRANFALTPVVAMMNADMNAKAFAGTESAVCGVVPFFICSPSEPVGNTNLNYPVDIPEGTGIQMLEGGNQKGPGNFGFLAYAGQGASSLEKALSTDKLFSECISSHNVETEPGQMTSVFDGLNRRFDLNVPCSQSPCSTSTNERKDLVRQAGSCNWKENPADDTNYQARRYRPTSNAALPTSDTPQIMGHPRDICHSVINSTTGQLNVQCAGGQIGNGVWDRGAYFRSNHPGVDYTTTAGLGANVTRYQTYLWEAQDPATRLTSKASSTSGWSAYGTPQAGVCNPPGIAPTTSDVDRRRLTAAVVNCRAYGSINGRKTLPVAAYMDVFLVEPTMTRNTCDGNQSPCKGEVTGNQDIYVEAIGNSPKTAQITRRTIPRLIE